MHWYIDLFEDEVDNKDDVNRLIAAKSISCGKYTLERVAHIHDLALSEVIQLAYDVGNKSIIDDFFERNNPYKKLKSSDFHMLAFAEYLEENKLDINDVTPKIMDLFRKNA